ncbi:methionyl-tRNA formyltransferase-like protein [Methylocystis sp.]|uniref:methionyl-tRNA formyltransferase-like protein n=1 Tax=Methylocystis sp. TaxID=1911079 RepID=UPI0025D81172|nr:methionyl-tRNA formyltransferase-like protein [Methylocystis sp.]
MEELNEILIEATQSIESDYFLLPIDGGPPVYRERVYTYELYHQMRMRWPSDCQFRLNGEVDKSAHPILRWSRAQKPDLLVHRAGSMAHNHAVIEVKSSQADPDGIKKDITTLSRFVREAGYQRAIFLIYGNCADRLVSLTQSIAAELEHIEPFELWLHHTVLSPAEKAFTLGRSNSF